MKNKMIMLVENVAVAGVYAMQITVGENDKKVLYVGSSLEINDALSRHLYHLKRCKYEGTNKAILQKYYDLGVLEFTILKESEMNCELKYMTLEEREQVQSALSVLEEMYIDLFKDTVCNKQKKVTKTSSNGEDFYNTRIKRHKANAGVKNPNCKYTEEDIKKIKLLIKEGYKNKEIAEIMNINSSYVSMIKNGQRWAEVQI